MRKIVKSFDQVWAKAETFNKRNGDRFVRCFDSRGKYLSFGIYDKVKKKYCLFYTINLTGNFRYNASDLVAELQAMCPGNSSTLLTIIVCFSSQQAPQTPLPFAILVQATGP